MHLAIEPQSGETIYFDNAATSYPKRRHLPRLPWQGEYGWLSTAE